jgi:hypothetical protein
VIVCTLHKIIHGKGQIIAPLSVLDLPVSLLADLPADAFREPTDRELAVFESTALPAETEPGAAERDALLAKAGAAERDALLAKAGELGITVRKNAALESLREAVAAAEAAAIVKKAPDTDPGVTTAPLAI